MGLKRKQFVLETIHAMRACRKFAIAGRARRTAEELDRGQPCLVYEQPRNQKLMQIRTVAILPVTLAVAISLCAGPLAAHEVYAPSVTPAIYLVNFLLLYMANPDLAAYMPAYKAAIPQSVVDCLEQNPTGTGCPYADYRQYFENPHGGGDRNRECFWPDVCQENARWARLAPRKFRQAGAINEPLGRRRADQLAHLLGMDASMILTNAEYHCVIGIPPRPPDRETIFRCIYNLTNSNGNAAIPLSSYGLNVTEQGNIRSICAPGSPCLEFNALFEGRLEEIFAECGCLDKFLRVVAETPLLQLIEDANPCQESGEPACLIETTCAGCGP